MSVKFEYVIEKITKLDNGEIEVLATSISSENIATPINPDIDMLMKNIPPQLQELMSQQRKMFQNTQRPLMKFRLTEKEYNEGKWRVGETIEVTITEGA
jgi:hypothetical protein